LAWTGAAWGNSSIERFVKGKKTFPPEKAVMLFLFQAARGQI
jgi:hypothetical protein